jgi:hypothetical protein
MTKVHTYDIFVNKFHQRTFFISKIMKDHGITFKCHWITVLFCHFLKTTGKYANEALILCTISNMSYNSCIVAV